MVVFEFVNCHKCQSDNWEHIGLFKNTENEGIQAECQDCGAKWEMIVIKRIVYKRTESDFIS